MSRWFTLLLTFPVILQAREVRDSDLAEPLESIGLIACLRHTKEAPALERYAVQEPDLLLWMGDNLYCDTLDMEELKSAYAALAKRPDFKALESIPMMATWDDHDFGWDNSGASYPKRDESKAIFMDFWNFPDDPAVRARPGVYSARVFGPSGKRVQVIMLDTRYSKDKTRMLSETQWKWLAEELERPAEFRVIVSGQQVLLTEDSAFEAWSKAGKEQQRLLDLIRQKATEGVFLVSGDQHYAEISEVAGGFGYDAVEFTFAGVNQDEKESANRNRVGPVIHARDKAGFLTFEWGETPSVTFRAVDTEGTELVSRKLSLADLRPANP
ncbi:alkaline phosphatase D family protein [Haloferula helveola]